MNKYCLQDAIRFNEIIEALQTDSFYQCRCIIKATELGQTAAVELASLENKYGALEKEVRDNMKERDKAVRSLKAEIELIRANSLRSSETQQDELNQVDIEHNCPQNKYCCCFCVLKLFKTFQTLC